MEQKNTLEALLDVVETKSTMDEFVQAFSQVLDLIETENKASDEKRAALEQYAKEAVKGINDFNTQRWSEVMDRVANIKVRHGVDGNTPVKGVDYFDGKPGEDAKPVDEQKIIDTLLARIKLPEPLQGSPDTPDEVIGKVNKSSLMIAKERVEGLMEAIRLAAANANYGGGITTSFFNGLRGKNLTIVGATAKLVGDTVQVTPSSSGGGQVNSVVAGTGITVDNTDPANPIVASTASGGTVTSVASADGSITVTNPNTTVGLSVVKSPKLTTARNIDGQSFDGTADITVIAPGTHAATSKATPVDADELPLADSAASFVLKKLTWANVKATLKTYFDSLYPSGSGTSSGTNTGDQTITLTSDVTGSGTGSFATTIANSAVTLAKMANMATSSLIYRKTAGTGAPEVNTLATLKTDLGLTGTNSGDQTITLTGGVTGSGTGSFAATVITNANLTGSITSSGNATTIANDVALPGNPTTTTQAIGDSSTKIATTAFVASAVLGQNFKEAVRVATTANLVGTYANGASGVGATFTYTAVGADVVDGVTLALGDRILLKNQSTDFQNGIYTVTTLGVGAIAGILTRATDANQSAEYKTGDSVFVTAGTTLTSTTWAYTGIDSPTMGTTSLPFVQVAGQGSFTGGNGITITGTSIAIDTAITVDKTTAQVLTNKDLSSATNTFPAFIKRTITSISTPQTAGSTANIDYVYFVSGTTTLTLPTAVSNTNLYTVKNTGSNTVTIAFTGGQTADGSATLSLSVANTSLDLVSDGSNWRIV